MITNIVLDIVESLCNLVQRLVAMLLVCLVDWMSPYQFRPTAYFMKTYIFPDGMWDTILKWMSMMGKFIAIGIFGYYIFMMAFFGFREVKDSIIRLIYRLIIVAVLNLSAVSFLDAIALDIGNPLYVTVTGGQAHGSNYESWFEYDISGSFYDWVVDSASDVADDVTEASSEELMGLTVPGAIGVESVSGTILGIVFILLRILLLGFCVWNFLKLCFELVRRYIVFGVMYMGFPAIVGTLASEPTSKIFHTYLKNFIMQIAMLVLSCFWIYSSLYAFGHVGDNSIWASLGLIAYMMIGVKLENFLKDQGLSVTSSAGSILDSMLSTAAQMSMASGIMKGAVGKAGSMLENVGGGIFGNSTLARIGSGMQGNGFDAAAGVKGTIASTGAQLKSAARELSSAMSGGALGNAAGHLSLTDSMAKDMMKMAGVGGFKNDQAFKEAFGKLGQADQSKFLNDYYKPHMLGIGADGKASNNEMMKALGATDAKQVAFTGMNKDGSIAGQVKTKAGTQAFSMDTNGTLKGNSVKAYDSYLNNDMYISKGDFTPAKMSESTPLSEFVADANVDSLQNSVLSSGLGHNAELMGAFIDSEGGIENVSVNSDGDLISNAGNVLVSDGKGNDFIKDNELAIDGLVSYWQNHESEYESFCAKNNIDIGSMDIPNSSGGDRGDFITFKPKDMVAADANDTVGYVALTGADNINITSNKGTMTANNRLTFIPISTKMNERMDLFTIMDVGKEDE